MADAGGRNIVVLSDGTGNSAAKLFKTNVWRTYDALDLSNASQIASYDDGVGTSSIKPLAMLGGAVGWGLKRNVLSLYTFLCLNYRPGDRIYGFGFSRGAFTMRVLINFVLSQGLVADATSSDDLRRKALRLYRKFRIEKTEYHGLHTLARPMRDAFVLLADVVSGQRSELKAITTVAVPEIEFLGLWDTVDAYGIPVAEFGKGVDQWIWPLSLGDRNLDPRIRKACHALSIDDKRETFHPLLWDESALETQDHTDEERLTQVWFAGAHANVGGGYPDDALSSVPLRWMIGEAAKRGIRFNPLAVAATDVKVSPYGRIYDARAGLGAYYRYEPRRLDPPRDRQGACIPYPKVHESVIWRIAMGTDAYAPLSLPNGVRIVTESRQPSAGVPVDRKPNILTFEDYRSAVCAEGDLFGAPAGKSADADRRKRAAEDFAVLSTPDDRTLELLWDTVWWRRIAYLATLISTALLVLFPFLPPTGIDWGFVFFPFMFVFPIYANTEVTWYVSSVESVAAIARSFLPEKADTWIDAFQKYPFSFLTLLATTVGFFFFGALLDRRIHDRALAAWRGRARENRYRWFRNSIEYRFKSAWVLAGFWLASLAAACLLIATDLFILAILLIPVLLLLGIPLAIWLFSLRRIRREGEQVQYEVRGPGLWLAHWLRTSRITVAPYRVLSSYVLPTTFAFVLIATGVYGLNRAVFAFAQSGGFVCQYGGGALPKEGTTIKLAANALCAESEAYLEAKTTYRLTISGESKWTDAGAEVSAFGIPFSWRKVWQFPLRRNLTNPWFVIIARVGDIGEEEYVLTDRTNEITPRKAGRLYLFVNEAILGIPGYDWFYKDNTGTVDIRVTQIAPPP